MGLNAAYQYCTCTAPLEPGDRLLLFTDGIYEVFDARDAEYGLEHLAAGVGERRDSPLEALLDGLLAEARGFAATKAFDDDVCLVALEVVAG